MAIYYEICPVCRHIKVENDPKYCTCVRTGTISKGDLVRADEKLVTVAQKCLDKGFRVLRCTMNEVFANSSTAIRIHFREDYSDIVDNLLHDLPPDWHTETDGPQDGEQYRHTVLIDYWPHPDSTEELRYALDLTISNLEIWLDDTLDNDGTIAVLTLAGYPVGQIKTCIGGVDL